MSPMTAAIIDLPVPPSVNETRRVDWSASRKLKRWRDTADGIVLVAKCRPDRPLRLRKIVCFEVVITVDERQTGSDLDNIAKATVDYLRRIELIENDAPKNMRKLTMQWGQAPEGLRVEVIERAQAAE
ncbi:hypothetical protein A33M_3345 [Rhodovulum sp. PH10]|uniref:hypothetical protein n=1 Tax=Rhodovulum sp. PH10 TaxID=1187851 RepID=UPI00027C2937|nr:hypothetical protein [Rhodovulum sp. PH10]EJW11267.1 hypothetical protein A33M_3345 [Rhodovulum sp. PH10]